MKYRLTGEYFLELRLKKKLSQEQVELKRVLTQGQLSSIENGDDLPNAAQLRHLAQRYEVDFKEFEGIIMEANQSLDLNQYRTRETTLCNLRKATWAQQYDQLKELVAFANEAKWLFKNPSDKALLDWYRGIVQQEFYKDYDKARDFLTRAIDASRKYKQKGLLAEITNSLAVHHIHLAQFEEAKKSLIQAQQILHSLSAGVYSPLHEIDIRILFNLTVISYQQENFTECIYYAQQAADTCYEHRSSYLEGEVYYLSGLGHYYTKDEEAARNQLICAREIFRKGKNDAYLIRADHKLTEFKLK